MLYYVKCIYKLIEFDSQCQRKRRKLCLLFKFSIGMKFVLEYLSDNIIAGKQTLNNNNNLLSHS